MTDSQHIYRMQQALRMMGWTVTNNPSLFPTIAGRTYYDRRHIDINCVSARNAMIVLAHEFGHVLDARRPQSSDVCIREKRAYLYGWAVVRWFKLPVTRDEWRAAHVSMFADLLFDKIEAAQ